MPLRIKDGADHKEIRKRASLPKFVEGCAFGDNGTIKLPKLAQSIENPPEENKECSVFFSGDHLEKTSKLVLYRDLMNYRFGKCVNFWDLVYDVSQGNKEELNSLYNCPVVLVTDLPMTDEGGDRTNSGLGTGVFFMFEHMIRSRKESGLRTYLQTNDDLARGTKKNWWRKSFSQLVKEGFIFCSEQ